MTEDPSDREGTDPAEPGRSERTLGAVRTTLAKRDSKGRPLAVYGILGIGVATLLALMLVIYFWSADRDQPEQPICTAITPARANEGVRDGEVEHLILGYDAGADLPTSNDWGPVLARIDYVNGQCATLPQGLANQTDILSILGAIAFYNQTTESAQVEITYNPMTDLPQVLFVTPTTVPTATQPPAPTTAPVSPVSTPVVPPTAVPTGLPATAEASPAATPRTTVPSPTPTRTPTATPSVTSSPAP